MYSCIAWSVYFVLAALMTFFHLTGGSISSLQYTVVNPFYSIATLMAVTIIIGFYRTSCASGNVEQIRASKYGLFGAFFGIFSLPLIIYVPIIGQLLSRMTDSLLYVPFVLTAVHAMDAVYPRADVALPTYRSVKITGTIAALIVAFVAFQIALGWSKVASGDICAFNTPYPTDAVQIALCTKSPLSQVDAYGRFMYSVTRYFTEDAASRSSFVEDPKAILLPKYDKQLPRLEVISETGYTIPTEDEDVEGGSSWLYDTVTHVIFDVLMRSPLIFPIHDSDATWKSLAEANSVLKLAGGPHLPEPVSDWTGVDVTSDDAIVQMVFAGMCGSRVMRMTKEQTNADVDKAMWSVDFTELAGLETRAGFERFGAKAFFDKTQKLVRIYWSHGGMSVRPGDLEWAHAKWVFRCSSLVAITAVEHLLENDLIYSNIVSTASRER